MKHCWFTLKLPLFTLKPPLAATVYPVVMSLTSIILLQFLSLSSLFMLHPSLTACSGLWLAGIIKHRSWMSLSLVSEATTENRTIHWGRCLSCSWLRYNEKVVIESKWFALLRIFISLWSPLYRVHCNYHAKLFHTSSKFLCSLVKILKTLKLKSIQGISLFIDRFIHQHLLNT